MWKIKSNYLKSIIDIQKRGDKIQSYKILKIRRDKNGGRKQKQIQWIFTHIEDNDITISITHFIYKWQMFSK